jgi:hypothetical protein
MLLSRSTRGSGEEKLPGNESAVGDEEGVNDFGKHDEIAF